MSEELKVARAKAETFCAAHLRECCVELAEWQNKGKLRAGKLRELGEMCEVYVGQHDGLKVAERMVERYAVELVATPPSPSTAEGERAAIPKPWPERMGDYYSQDGSKLMRGTGYFKDQEIAEWRARAALAANAADSEAKERDAVDAERYRLARAALANNMFPYYRLEGATEGEIDEWADGELAAMKAKQKENTNE